MLHIVLLAASASMPAPPGGVLPIATPKHENGPQTLPASESQPPLRRPGISAPAFLTAGDLQAKCQDKALAAVSYCYAYVTGVHDSVKAYETWLNMREFCRPVRLSQSELRQAFLEYVAKNSGSVSGEAASVVVVALRQKYACDASIEPAAP